MIYLQPKFDQGVTNNTAALLRVLAYNGNPAAFAGDVPQVPQPTAVPTVISVSEYTLYTALLVALVAGGLALAIRLSSALHSLPFFGFIFRIFHNIVIWLTILGLLCSFGLLFIAATLQLPVVVNSFS